MSEGKVRWFNYQRGYGFIDSAEHEDDIFLHHSEFVKEEYIHEGSTVLFTAESGEKGLQAKKVTLKKEQP